MATWTVDEDAANFSLLNCNKGKINMLEMITGSTAPAWDFVSRIFFISGVGTSYDAYTHQFFGGGARNRFMVIDENGNVGINVSGTPVQKLDVNGNINTSGSVASNVQLTLQNGVSPRWATGKVNAESSGNVGSDFFIARYSDAGAFINNPFFIKRSNGFVGIGGVGNPFYALQVAGDIAGSGNIEMTGSGKAFNGGGSNVLYGFTDLAFTGYLEIGVTTRKSKIEVLTDGAANSGAFVISTTNAGPLAERMRISASGQVAIGGAPISTYKLSVTGESYSTSNVYSGAGFFAPHADLYNYIAVGIPPANYAVMSGDGINLQSGASALVQWNIGRTTVALGGNFQINRYNDSGTFVDTTITILRASGNVGIGVASPGYKLDVAGDCNITGSYRINGGNGRLSTFSTNVYLDSIADNASNIYLRTGTSSSIRVQVNNVGMSVMKEVPAYALDVSGDCNITGTYRVNGVPLSTGTGQNQSPWLSNIDGGGFSLSNVSNVTASLITANRNGYPIFTLYDSSGGLNQKWQRIQGGPNGDIDFIFASDDGSITNTWLRASRTGVAVPSLIDFPSAAPVNVNAQIWSKSGGFKFPDSTIQTTAALTKAAYQTPWTQDIDANNFALNNLLTLNGLPIQGDWTYANANKILRTNSGNQLLLSGGIETPGITIAASATPVIIFNATGNALNEKIWQLLVSGPSLHIQLRSDDFNTFNNFIAFKRIGTTIVGVGIGKDPIYSLDVLGNINITGNYKVNGVNLSTGGSQTPWTSDIDGGTHNLSNVNAISVTSDINAGNYVLGLNQVKTKSFQFANHGASPGFLGSITGFGNEIYFDATGIAGGAIIFRTASYVEQLRVTDNGVGVRKSPAYTLDVNGDINFTGKLYHNGVEVDLGTTDLTPVLNRLPAALVGGKMDSVVSAPVTIQGDLTTEMKVSIRNEISGEFDEPGSELSSIPTTAGSIRRKIDFIFQYFRNKRTITSSVETLYKEGGADPLGGTTVVDDGNTVTIGEKS